MFDEYYSINLLIQHNALTNSLFHSVEFIFHTAELAHYSSKQLCHGASRISFRKSIFHPAIFLLFSYPPFFYCY